MNNESVCAIIHEFGTLARELVRTLPVQKQSLAWAGIAAAVTAAGIHDSDDPDLIIGLVQASIDAMAPYIAEKKLLMEEEG